MEVPVCIIFRRTSPGGIWNIFQVAYTLFHFHGHCRERMHILWHSYHSPKYCNCQIIFLLRLTLYHENFRDLTELTLDASESKVDPTSQHGYKKEFFSLNYCLNKISDYNSFFHKSFTISYALSLASINLNTRNILVSLGSTDFI